MIPIWHRLSLIWWALLHDENAVRRWVRMVLGALALYGASWAEQVESFSHRWAVAVRVAAALAVVIVAAHGDPVTPPSPATGEVAQ